MPSEAALTKEKITCIIFPSKRATFSNRASIPLTAESTLRSVIFYFDFGNAIVSSPGHGKSTLPSSQGIEKSEGVALLVLSSVSLDHC